MLLALSQAPYHAGWLAFVALAPYLAAGEIRWRAGWRARYETLDGALLGLGYYGLMLYWIAFLPEEEMTYPILRLPAAAAMIAYLALYVVAFAAALSWLRARGRVPLLVAAPIAWTGMEWLRGSGPLAFPWGGLGYALAPHPVALQMAAVVGVLGLTAWVALANALLAELYLAWRDGCGARGARSLAPRAGALVLVIALPLLLGAAVLRAHPRGASRGPSLQVALVQPNVIGVEKWRPNFRDWNLAILDSMTLEAGRTKADCIIWPETAATSYLRFEPDYARSVYHAVGEAGSPLIAGFLDAEPRGAGVPYLTYNAAGLILPNGGLRAVYRKMHLVPFGEEIPFRNWIPILKRLDLGEADFDAGTKPVILTTGKMRAGVLICFEAIFPGLGRTMEAAGANLLVNITNDSWFGDSPAPRQHMEMAVVRAVELRRSIARCANTGISCFVDPWGRVTARGGVFTREILTGAVTLEEGRTLFARFGGFLDPAWMAALAALLAWGAVRSRR